MKNRPISGLAFGLFFLSGLTSLIYEVIWVRLLTQSFGVSAFAVATVLLAFMGGLCAGSFWFGRIADNQRKQMQLYGAIEGLIGVYALLLPLVLEGASSFYIFVHQQFDPSFYTLSLIRLLCSTVILALPTFLMGGTLPLLTAALFDEAKGISRQVAKLYAVNTLGAAMGCLLAGYVLIPALGLHGTTFLASACNVIIFVFTWLKRTNDVSPRPSSSKDEQVTPSVVKQSTSDHPAWLSKVVLVCFALSGLCAMAYQIIWTRLLSMIVGTTVYAFTTILAVFLIGIVIGSSLYRGWIARNAFLAFAIGQLGVGLFVFATLPYFDQLPFLFLKIYEASQSSWYAYQGLRMALIFLVLLGPTICFGLALPQVIEICGHKKDEPGRAVGTIYAVNTIGAIFGSFVGGFVLIPFLGLQKSLLVSGLVNIISGLTLAAFAPTLEISKKAALLASGCVAAFAFTFLLRPWNLHYLNSGPYIYAHEYNSVSDVDSLKKILDSYSLKFFQEDATASVSVFDIQGTLSLAIDGKTDASTGGNADMSTQILLAHLPAMLTQDPGNALLIGLGSGVSLGSLLRYKVSSVDVLEISEAVVAASRLFSSYNFQALDDPRTNLIVADGRHHLLRTKKTYDLIVSQPSNPWISGVSNLFTTEYYSVAYKRLSEKGIMCQWVPSYHMSQPMLAVILKSFTSVFPNASLWTSSVPGDLFIIGSKTPHSIDFPLFKERINRPGVREDLARIGMADSMLLAKTFKFDSQEIKKYVERHAAGLPANTDMNPIVEFMTPRFLLTQKVAKGLRHRDQLTGELSSLLEHIRFGEEQNRDQFKINAQRILGQ